MSVVDVTEMWSKLGGSISCEKNDALDQKYAFTRGFQVLHTVDTYPNAVKDATGIPLYGEQHPSGLAAFVTNKSQPQRMSPILSQVIVSYEGEAPDPGTVSVKWGVSGTTEPIDRDWDGAAIVTANNEQVDGLTIDIYDRIAVITRKFLTVNLDVADTYLLATNSDTFLGKPPGTGRMIDYTADNEFKYGAPREQWTVTVKFAFRKPYQNTTDAQAWYKRWRHEGLLVRDTAGGPIRRAVDGFNQEVTKPVLLKADGTEETDPNSAEFKHTKVLDSLPFSALGLL